MPQALRRITLPLADEWICNFNAATNLSFIPVLELPNRSGTNITL